MNNLILDRNKCCCFTGPRPEKIDDNIEDIIYFLNEAILHSIKQGYKYFFTGMSRGIDLIAGELILSLQKDYDINLVAAIPFSDQSKSWTEEDKELYSNILLKVRYSFVISETFNRSVYYTRNRFMIDSCSKVISYYKNSQGGTKYTLDYAKKAGIEIVNIADTQLKLEL